MVTFNLNAGPAPTDMLQSVNMCHTSKGSEPLEASDAKTIKVAVFGHNANEPAVKKRARSLGLAGFEVIGIMPFRGKKRALRFKNVSLGQTWDNQYLRRSLLLLRALRLNPQNSPEVADIDVIIARNLDMLICAQIFRRRNRLNVPLVYECLDIHSLLARDGLLARMLRRVENALLRRTSLLLYPAEQMEQCYFRKYHTGHYTGRLIENRMLSADVEARPVLPKAIRNDRLRIGWIGNLRCRTSFDILKEVARRFNGRVEVHIHGYPARTVFPDFEREVEETPGLIFHGSYDGATELAAVYKGVDVLWASDWYEKGRNSVWQLPNRIYEGGYYGVPAIASAGTETGRVVEAQESGWAITDPFAQNVIALCEALLDDPRLVSQKSANLLALPVSRFVETPQDTRAVIEAVLEAGANPETA